MSQSKRVLYSVVAGVVFIVHFILVLVVTFGWLFDSLFYAFATFLLLTVLSELIFGACILSIWEFGLRKKINPSKQYDTSCIMHYGRGLFGLKPRVRDTSPKTFFKRNSFQFILLLLLLMGSIYNYYL